MGRYVSLIDRGKLTVTPVNPDALPELSWPVPLTAGLTTEPGGMVRQTEALPVAGAQKTQREKAEGFAHIRRPS